jgi:hypothetical protein
MDTLLFLEAGDSSGASNWSGTELAVAAIVIVVVCALICKYVLD